MSKGRHIHRRRQSRWNAREHLSFMQALEAELTSPEMVQAVAEEREAMDPMNRIVAEHGADWLDEEQADWEAGR